MFGQHAAQNGNVISGISKAAKTLNEIMALGKLSTRVNCSCRDYQQEERAADQQWLFWWRPTLAFVAEAWEQNNAATLVSQTQAQHLYKYLLLMAVTYKAVLLLRKKKREYRNSGCWSMDTDDPSRARGWEEGKGIQGSKQCSCTRDSRERQKLISDTCSNWEKNEQGPLMFCYPQSFIVGCSL